MTALYAFIEVHNDAVAAGLAVWLLGSLIFGVCFLVKTLSAGFDAADGEVR